MSSATELDGLTEDEKNAYISEKVNKFKITIAVCVIYGSIAAALLLVAFFTSWGKKYLYDEMLAFVITYIIGTIIIIVYLSNEVYNYKPVVSGKGLNYNAELCPDYWKLMMIEENSVENGRDADGKAYFDDKINKLQFKYKCVMDESIYNKRELIKDSKYKKNPDNKLYIDSATNNNTSLKDSELDNFKEYSATMLGYNFNTTNGLSYHSSNAFKNNNNSYFTGTNVPVACDVVYPVYLSIMDSDYQTKNPDKPNNTFRCAYAKACGISWTDAGCDK